MAYNYDEFGNVIGEYESEEERRAREAKQLADTAVHTQETKTYGDGTVERVTKEAIPPIATPTIQPIKPMAEQPAAAAIPQPQFDRTAYNASIAQQESGSRPDIGYHDKTKSSAFGLYGITAPAYADARRVNPNLPEDITKATPEQQTEAQNIITGNNAKFLQSKGIEPTPGALSAAHFAGPSGLHKFLTQTDEQGRPYISPQAQAANGGYDKARAIIESRLSGGMAASSGAVQRPTAMPGEGVAVATGQGVQGTMSMMPQQEMGPVSPEQINQQAQQFAQELQPYAQAEPVSPYSLATGMAQPGIKVPGMTTAVPGAMPTTQAHELFQKNQDDMQSLISMRNDPSLPEHIRKRSGDRAYELMNNEYQKQAAIEKAATLTPLQVGKAITTEPKDQEGSWLKYVLLSWINPKHAENEASKLNISPTTWTQSTIKDENGNDVNVEIRTDKTGKMFEGVVAGTNERLTPAQLQEAAAGFSTGKGFKPEISGTAYVKTDEKGNVIARGVRTSKVVGNKTVTVIESGGKTYDINQGWEPESISTATAKAEAGKKISLAWDPIIKAATTSADALTKANIEYGTSVAIVGYGAPGTANAGKPILVDQGTGQLVQPDATGKVTVSQGLPPGGTSALKTQAEINKQQGIERSQSNEKYNEKLATNRETAQPQKATIGRLQSSIDKNPEFWGIDTNSPAWRAFVDVQSSNENKAEALNTLARNLNIPQNKRAEFDQTMNDYRNLQVNAITGSGLSASQTNTERESQRVLGTVGSISDKPAAAKATLEYAKAKIEYTEAKAKAWAEARKANPNIDRLAFDIDFEANQGEKIFADANQRMADIIAGKPTVGTVKGGYRFKGGNPADKNNWEKV